MNICPECNEREQVKMGYLCTECWERISMNREIKAGANSRLAKILVERLKGQRDPSASSS